MFKELLIIFIIIFCIVENGYAYVGPGLGLGVIGAVIGIVVAVLLSIIGIVWYPLKRLYKKVKSIINKKDGSL